jgi:hypothetical protein
MEKIFTDLESLNAQEHENAKRELAECFASCESKQNSDFSLRVCENLKNFPLFFSKIIAEWRIFEGSDCECIDCGLIPVTFRTRKLNLNSNSRQFSTHSPLIRCHLQLNSFLSHPQARRVGS